jgi:hypothetical protein
LQGKDADTQTDHMGVRYLLYRDYGALPGDADADGDGEAEHVVLEYSGPNTQHVAEALETGKKYRFALRVCALACARIVFLLRTRRDE